MFVRQRRLDAVDAATREPTMASAPLIRGAGERDSGAATRARHQTPSTRPHTQAYNLVKAGLLEKPLEFGFVMGAPNAQECDLGVPRCCGAFTLLM